ncbi:Diaminopimelate epimerase-like protein [Rickenella mellea]|uniref:Diaminopimelate epimerase-like protein n=1 Tax=Rickenella mellea TaxID=50990 RepID=A0A4Y7Q2N8_9AGAM|nr:Diaminopimelate epimerase-like protein [Rickenella mellea]
MSPSTLSYTVADAFTKRVFGGNPASVIVLDKDHALSDATLQLIAREFNVSQTAFITPTDDLSTANESRSFGLRWFTPTVEVPLCGHATLASAHVLFSSPHIIPKDVKSIAFHTLSGELTCGRLGDGRVELELPAGVVKKAEAELEKRAIDAVHKALGETVEVKFVGRGEGPTYKNYLLVHLDDSFDLKRAKVNAGVFPEISEHPCIILTTVGQTPNENFVSRFFAPQWGVAEDPVCGSAHCDHNLSDQTLQLIAREFNFSETAFITPKEDVTERESQSFGLRWFTPMVESPICGHATLASTHVLFSSPHIVPSDVKFIRFHTLAGELICKRLGDGRIELEFPAVEVKKVEADLEKRVIDAVHKAVGGTVEIKFVGGGEGKTYENYLLIQLEDSFDLKGAKVNADIFTEISEYACILLTTIGRTPKEHFVSRFFAPRWGVTEDPVCGSAHCVLGPYWQKYLRLQSGEVMVAKQVSERGGDIEVIWNAEKGTCRLRGHAAIAAKGGIYLPE